MKTSIVAKPGALAATEAAKPTNPGVRNPLEIKPVDPKIHKSGSYKTDFARADRTSAHVADDSEMAIARAVHRFNEQCPNVPYHVHGGKGPEGIVVAAQDPNDPRFVSLQHRMYVITEIETSAPLNKAFKVESQNYEGGKGATSLTSDDVVRAIAGRIGIDPASLSAIGNLEVGLQVALVSEPGRFLFVAIQENSDATSVAVRQLLDTPVSYTRVKAGGSREKSTIETLALHPHEGDVARDVEDVAHTITTSDTPMPQLIAEGRTRGAFLHGHEEELWVYDRVSRKLLRLYGGEAVTSLAEQVIGRCPHASWQEAFRAWGRDRLRLRRDFGDRYLLLPLGTPPAGLLDDVDVNSQSATVSDYTALMTEIRRRALDTGEFLTPENLEIKAQQAALHGGLDVQDFLRQYGVRTNTVAAAHNSIGTISTQMMQGDDVGFVVSGLIEVNMLAIYGGMLATGVEMLNVPGPYLNGRPMFVYGRMAASARHFAKTTWGTAQDPNHMPRSIEDVKQWMIKGIVSGSIDRVARARLAHERNGTTWGSLAHGRFRSRTEPSRGIRTQRGELTGSDATSFLQVVRGSDLMDVLMGAIIIASAQGRHVLDFLSDKTGYSPESLFYGSTALMSAFCLQGPSAPEVGDYFRKIDAVLEAMSDVRAIQPMIDGTATSFDVSLRTFGTPITFHDLAQGRGTLAGAMMGLAAQGYSGHQAAIRADAFFDQTGLFATAAAESQMHQHKQGKGGFEYEEPDVGEPEGKRILH